MIAGLSRQELLDEALARSRDSFVPFPGLELRRRAGWVQLVTPLFASGGFNEVALAQLEADEADAIIDATIAEYDALGIRFRWTVGPDSRPADLGARLARRGLVGERGVLMAAAVAEVPVEVGPGLTVERVEAAQVDRFAAVSAQGWGSDPEPLRVYHRALLADPSTRSHSFLASVDGAPAGVASYVAHPRSAYFIGGVVLPAFRGRGVYRALLAARLRHAAARGIPVVLTHARASTSAPILARLGFHALAELESYRRP